MAPQLPLRSIICDLERRRIIVRLLADREPATAQAWLLLIPGSPSLRVIAVEDTAKRRHGAAECHSGCRSLASDGERQPRIPRCGPKIDMQHPSRDRCNDDQS
jgi:hypothetical protein